jgi:hypothetical protein
VELGEANVTLSPRSRAAATLVVGLVFAFALGSTGALAPDDAAAFGSSSALTRVSGEVLVGHAGESFAPAREGDVLVAGDTIRTGASAVAEITYFEGSSVRLEENTELVITALESASDGGTIVTVAQAMGRTWHVVTKLLSGSSRYEVKTPTTTASVRGTIFSVDVATSADGASATVTTSEGTVLHTADEAPAVHVSVQAGQQSTKTARMKAPEPAHAAPAATLRTAPKRPAPAARATQRPVPSRAPVRAVSTDKTLKIGTARDRARVAETPKPKRR